jgi:predicted DNA-binding protein with PD1-like motif
MSEQAARAYPRARTLTHPGPFNPIRIQTRSAQSARHIRLLLLPGESLFDALIQPLKRMGIESASTTILGGDFERLSYCTAPPDPTHNAVIAYTAPIDSGRSCMIFGNATIGKTVSGAPLVHCHAAIRTESNEIQGGHIIPQTSIIGPRPITALVTSLDAFELKVAFDAETNIPLIQPHDTSREP